MGFRDIHCFNLAWLAKQAWRLIDNPDSLCVQIRKAKYYPDGDLINVALRKKASYTWQSIMAGVETLRHGYIWRVGDGEQIKIWEDPWIPQSPSRKVISPRGNNILSRVSDLIDPTTGHWDEQLVMKTFWHVDVQRILDIPLSLHEMRDFLAWNPTKTGVFMVRSAYKVEWESQFGTKLQQLAGPSFVANVWDSVWSLLCPAKIKIFI